MRHATWLLLLTLSGALSAQTLEEIVARHVEAHGGQAVWAQVRGLRLQGTATAFSEAGTFDLCWQRPDRYHIQFTLMGSQMVEAHDGTVAWQRNPWYGLPCPIRLDPAEASVVRRETVLPTPLFRLSEEGSGFTATYVGLADLDGQEGHRVTVTWPDGIEDTWYLDPTTYLAFARVSPGAEYGRVLEQTTFLDDYREVEGLVLPHLVEKEFGSRVRTLELESVAVNPEEQPGFAFPVPAGMERLQVLAGDWTLQIEERSRPDQPFRGRRVEGTGTVRLDGALVELTWQQAKLMGVPITTLLQWRHDPVADRAHLLHIDDLLHHPNDLAGVWTDDGKLILDNLASGSPATLRGKTTHERLTLRDLAPDGFGLDLETSTDGGENWLHSTRITATRPVPDHQ
jgi:hypothetical protein